MRNIILYLYTEDLNFFYRLNRELARNKIQFEILSGVSKIPDLHAILLTTSQEIHNLKENYKKLKILEYDVRKNFNHYIYKILAAYRIGYKEFYSDMIFSIDPGSKKIGLVVFLDDYYLVSHTFYDQKKIIDLIKDYVNCFQTNNPHPMKLTFKLGSGVLPMTKKLTEKILDSFQKRNSLKIFLINESKSSKVRIRDLKKKFKTKHELSALILALRSGVEINHLDKWETYKKFKFRNSDYIKEYNNIRKHIDPKINFQDVMQKILQNEISLSESSELLY